MRNLRAFLIGLAATAMMVLISYLWIDRPLSYFAHNELAQRRVFHNMQRLPEFMEIFACLIFGVTGYYALLLRPIDRLLSTLLLSGISLSVAAEIKNQLKFVFGRTWPETWVQDNPSLIRDGVSGFNFFHGGAGFSSFPSGHMTLTCAAVAVFWISYPRYRPLYAIVIATVAIGLIGANYHFLSDIVAGVFLGWCTGWIATLVWNAATWQRFTAKRDASS